MARITKTISLTPRAYKKAKRVADRLFGKNLSAFFEHLVSKQPEVKKTE